VTDVLHDDDAAPDPLTALVQMANSPGYALLIEHARLEHGSAAQLRRIRQALTETPAADHSAVTQSIIATSEAVLKLFVWVDDEIQRLRPLAQSGDPYQRHRRLTI
jgi:hypothetical protein